MQQLAFAILGALIQGAGTLVGRVLLSLGIGYVTYTGLDTSLDWLKVQIQTSFNALPPEAIQILSALKVGAGISVLISALSARLVLNGLTSGSIKKMVIK